MPRCKLPPLLHATARANAARHLTAVHVNAGSYKAAAYLVDVLALREQGAAAEVMRELGAVFGNPTVCKVLHDARAVRPPPRPR